MSRIGMFLFRLFVSLELNGPINNVVMSRQSVTLEHSFLESLQESLQVGNALFSLVTDNLLLLLICDVIILVYIKKQCQCESLYEGSSACF